MSDRPRNPADPRAPDPAADPFAAFDPTALGGTSVDPVIVAFWETLRRLPRYLRLALALGTDGRVPGRAKAAVGVGGVYALSPIDLIPGLIPVAGQLDDVIVLLLTLRRALRACPEPLATEHLERVGLGWADIDADLAVCRATLHWVAVQGLRLSGRLARATGRRVWGAVRPAPR